MRDNINKVAERGERLDSLESKTGIPLLLYDCVSELTLFFSRQSRSLSARIPAWSKSCSKANVVESKAPLNRRARAPFSLCSVLMIILGYEDAFMSYWWCDNSPCHYHWYSSSFYPPCGEANCFFSSDCCEENLRIFYTLVHLVGLLYR
jgi:hypothetical protein